MNSERLHALDAVRGFAMLAGVVLHAAMSFLPEYGALGFPIPDRFPSLALGVVYYVIHMFRMTTFFLIAGFFGRLLLHRLGAAGFVRNRGVRILIPFVVGWVVIYPTTMGAFLWAARDVPDVPAAMMSWPTLSLRHFPLTHLWFLYFLILTYVFTLVTRAAWLAIDRTGTIALHLDRWLRQQIQGPFLMIALAAPTTLALLLFAPGWRRWFGVPTPDQSFIPSVSAIVAFGGAYALGWFLHRQPDLLGVWERRWPIHLVIALAMTGVSLSLVGFAPELGPAVQGWKLAIYAASYTIGTWAWAFSVVGVALRFFNARSPVRRYLADASYWIYLVHVPLLFFLQAAVMDLPWHWSVKFFVILTTALALLFASYQILVRDTVLGVVLNGRRHGRRGRPPATVQVRPSVV